MEISFHHPDRSVISCTRLGDALRAGAVAPREPPPGARITTPVVGARNTLSSTGSALAEITRVVRVAPGTCSTMRDGMRAPRTSRYSS